MSLLDNCRISHIMGLSRNSMLCLSFFLPVFWKIRENREISGQRITDSFRAGIMMFYSPSPDITKWFCDCRLRPDWLLSRDLWRSSPKSTWQSPFSLSMNRWRVRTTLRYFGNSNFLMSCSGRLMFDVSVHNELRWADLTWRMREGIYGPESSYFVGFVNSTVGWLMNSS